MPRQRRKPAGATATAEPKAKPKPKAEEPEEKAAEDKAAKAAAKAAERQQQEAEQLEAILERYVNGDESLAVVAKSLNITSGKAAFILMKHDVAEGEVPAIKGKDDETLVKAIHEAREEAGDYSSWGWLAARSGKPESWIKAHLEDAGLYEPKAVNIASVRAEKNKPEPEPEPEQKTTTTRRRRRGNA